MNLRFPLWIFAFCSLLTACGGSNSFSVISGVNTSQEDGIIGGIPEKKTSSIAHSTVALRTKSDRGFFCSASILDERTLLTAAHCIEEQDLVKNPIEAVFDVNGFSHLAIAVDIDKAIIHPNYIPYNLLQICPYSPCTLTASQYAGPKPQADLAVIHLTRSIPSEYRAVLLADSSNGLTSVKSATASGYGTGLAGLTDSGHYRSEGILRSMKSTVTYVPAAQTLLIQSTAQQAICYGDSGGPLLNIVGSQVLQLGVASHLNGPSKTMACGSQSGAYTAVAAYATWIRQAQKDILKQKVPLSAAWLTGTTNNNSMLGYAGIPKWLKSDLQQVDFSCNSTDSLTSAKISFHFSQSLLDEDGTERGKTGSGTAMGTVINEGKTYEFHLPTGQPNEEANLMLLNNDDGGRAAWAKTMDRVETIKGMLDGSTHGLDLQQGTTELTINTDEATTDGEFTVTSSSGNSIVLTAPGASLALTTPGSSTSTKIPCQISILFK